MPIEKQLLESLSTSIKEVIEYSQEIETGSKEWNIEKLINQWYEAKKNFITAFNLASGSDNSNHLIYEFPGEVSFELDETIKMSKLTSFMEFVSDYCWNTGVGDIATNALIKFIDANKNSFFENKVTVPFTYKDIEIKTGIKLLKAFKFFVPNPYLDKIQTVASMLIQESKITGRFCVSVHPLDYLSSSESTYNWRSCHSLDGDYRGGNMAYMVDSCTVVCYLRGENEEKLPRFPKEVPWNSKKWRMLLFFNDEKEIFAAGRQYPFEAKSMMEFVREKVIPLITRKEFKSSWGHWHIPSPNYSEWDDASIDSIMNPQTYPSPFQLNDTYINIRGNLYGKKEIIIPANDLFYNDLLHSTKYIPSFCHTLNGRDVGRKIKPFHVGGDPICPCCGKNKLQSSEEMVCPECDLYYGTQTNEMIVRCYDCGERVLKEEAYCDDSGDYYCENCWNDYREEEY